MILNQQPYILEKQPVIKDLKQLILTANMTYSLLYIYLKAV